MSNSLIMANNNRAALSLRIGLGLFMLIWGLMKFVQTDWLINNAYKKFWGFMPLSPVTLYIIGIIQIVIAIMLFIGWKTSLAALIGGIIHLGTSLVTIKQIFTPFTIAQGAPPHFFFFAAVPVLFAFIALYYLEW